MHEQDHHLDHQQSDNNPVHDGFDAGQESDHPSFGFRDESRADNGI